MVAIFICAFCKKNFAKKFILKKHILAKHSCLQIKLKSSKAIKCFACSSRYSSKKAMYTHCRRKHAPLLDHFPIPQNKKIKENGKRTVKKKKNLLENVICFPPELLEKLPIHHCAVHNFEKVGGHFTADFSFSINNLDDAEGFRELFENHNKERYIKGRSSVKEKGNILIKTVYHCHHNSQKKDLKKNRKNLNCPARFMVKVQKDDPKKCLVHLDYSHNHHTQNEAALNLLQPTAETVQKFEKMFEGGLSPSKALKIHEQELMLEHGDEFYLVAADRQINPDIQWVFHHYYKVYKRNYGKAHGEEMLQHLEKMVEEINNKNGDNCAKISIHEDSSFTIAIMLPIMKRISSSSLASDICFIDSSGNMDRYGCRVFVMLCTSPCGGLPVGLIITTSESEDFITEGLQLYASLQDENSFGGRGRKGPYYFMTDASDAERNALGNVYPESILLLCIFHVLQAVWRWLQESKNKIDKGDRPQLFRIFKKLIYAKNEEHLKALLEEMENDELINKYSNFRNYLQIWMSKINEWVVTARKSERLRGSNTNNISEAAMRVLKDNIFDRTRAYSPCQLLDFLTKDFPNFYERKILKTAGGRPAAYLKTTVRKNKKFDRNDYKIECFEDNIFKVENIKNNNDYLLNMNLSLCSCPMGDCGARCKHYYIVKEVYQIKHVLDLPNNEEEKMWLHYLATGSKNVPPNWYSGLKLTENKDTVPETPHLLPVYEENATDNIVEHKIVEIEEKESMKEDRKLEIIRKFRENVDEICQRVEKNPDLLEALNVFNDQFRKTSKTDAALKSGLICYGKYNGHKQKMRYAGSSKIGVQPTAIARRKTKCGGRRALFSGRPAKTDRLAEHGYNKETQKNSLAPKKRRAMPAPHDIGHCLTENISLGKSH